MLDIDYFKKINDTYGHQIGDAVLVGFAGMIKQIIRKRDVCARVGGEEFAVLLTDIGEEEALLTACRILRVVETRIFNDGAGDTFGITCSIGVVIEENCSFSDVNTMYKQADNALYAAKETGRNRICFCDARGRIKQVVEEELAKDL